MYHEPVKRNLKRICLSLLTILFLSVFSLGALKIYQGYKLYRQSIEQVSIRQAVEPIMQDNSFVPYEELSQDFVHGVVAVEDQRYFKRYGFDWIALCRALLNNLEAGAFVEGGSTISQQIGKNLYYERVPRGITHKVAEVFLMYDLERTYTKEELLAVYVNMNYYGDGYFGIQQAAEGYYGQTPSSLTLAQAAMLAGIPNAPAAYQLSTGYDKALKRMAKVLKRMEQEHFITHAQREQALQEDMHPVIKQK